MKQFLLYLYDKIYNQKTPVFVKKIADAVLVTCAFAGTGSLISASIIGEHHGIVLFFFWTGVIAKFTSECVSDKSDGKS